MSLIGMWGPEGTRLVIHMFGISDAGCLRNNNEDRFCIDEKLGLCLLADGMGGHGHGEVAATIAVEVGHRFMVASRDGLDMTWPFGYDHNRTMDENRVVNAIQLANRRIWNAVKENPHYAGMGSTLIVVSVDEKQSAIGSVGDSRVYLLRDAELHQLSIDDSWVGERVRDGSLSAGEARGHSMRNVLTQAVGTHYELDVHTVTHLMLDGDTLLLATDGIYGVVEPSAMRSILYSHSDARPIAETLLAAALEAGGPDNASCIVLCCRERRQP
jgi:serine/threonine protein phosphatase PrpC